MSNCDEFIFYDDLVRDTSERNKGIKASTKNPVPAKVTEKSLKSSDERRQEAINFVREITEALYAERGDRAKLWGSMIKQTLKRRRPGFNESFYGFASFNDLLEEAQARGYVELEMDERSGGYVIRRIKRES
jgi:hypothetical protein